MSQSQSRYVLCILSRRLKELRSVLGFSQSRIASYLGIDQRQWSRYERGVTCPSLFIIMEICSVFSVSSDWLFGLKEDSE